MKKILLVFTALILLSGSAHALEVTLGWSESTGATGYKLYWGTESGVYTNSMDVGNVLQGTISDLSDGAYYFAVTAYNDVGESGYSPEAFLDTLPIDAPAGYDTEVTKVGDDYQMIHTCPVVASATGYRLYQNEAVAYDGPEPTFTQTLPSGTYDFYWVAYKPKKIDNNGTVLVESSRSVEKTLHLTVPTAPSQPTLLMVVP